MAKLLLDDEGNGKRASYYNGMFDCPLCFQVFKNPILQVACGHRFCKICLRGSNEKPPSRCPLDGQVLDKNKIFHDVAFENQIADVNIICCYSTNGCAWEGDIQSLKEHRETCKFIDQSCPKGCGKRICNLDLNKHNCNSSTVSCERCFMEIEEDLTETHDCLLESRPGPEGQSSRIMPAELEDKSHSSKGNADGESLKQCRFYKLGCKFKGNRFELDLHIDIASEKHLDLVCKSVQDIKTEYIKKENKVITKHDNKIKLLQDYILKQNVVIQELHETKRGLELSSRNLQTQVEDLKLKSDNFLEEITRLKVQANLLQDERSESSNCYTGSLLWKIKNVSEKLENAINKTELSIYSRPFFTSRHGYKVRAQLFLNGVGCNTGEYVSIYFHVMPTDHDSILKWPFSHKITFALLEQADDIDKACNISYTLVPTPGDGQYLQPSEEMSEGRGCNQFISIEKLKKGNYIKNNCLFVKVKVNK